MVDIASRVLFKRLSITFSLVMKMSLLQKAIESTNVGVRSNQRINM